MVIYLITNKVTGFKYVGQTRFSSAERRYKQHLSHAYSVSKKHKRHTKLYEAVRKYGKEAFEVSTLEEVETLEELNNREVFWISKLGTKHPFGYNLTCGGDDNPMDNPFSRNKHDSVMGTDKVRKAISDSMKKFILENPDSRKGRIPWNKGLTKEQMAEHSKKVEERDGNKRLEFRKKKKVYRDDPEVKKKRKAFRKERRRSVKTV